MQIPAISSLVAGTLRTIGHPCTHAVLHALDEITVVLSMIMTTAFSRTLQFKALLAKREWIEEQEFHLVPVPA